MIPRRQRHELSQPEAPSDALGEDNMSIATAGRRGCGTGPMP